MNRHDPPPGRPPRVLASPEAIQAKLRENRERRPRITIKWPRIGHPTDLGDQLLGELSHLFLTELAQRPSYTTDPHAEALSVGDYFDMTTAAHEMAEWAMVVRRRRLNSDEACRTPWEKGVR